MTSDNSKMTDVVSTIVMSDRSLYFYRIKHPNDVFNASGYEILAKYNDTYLVCQKALSDHEYTKDILSSDILMCIVEIRVSPAASTVLDKLIEALRDS